MKTIITEYDSIEHFLYPWDLEKMETKDLIYILRGLRCDESRERKYPWNEERDMDGEWLEYSWSDLGCGTQERWYSMIWMVKKVLANRENISTSKADRKKERMEKSRNRDERLIRSRR